MFHAGKIFLQLNTAQIFFLSYIFSFTCQGLNAFALAEEERGKPLPKHVSCQHQNSHQHLLSCIELVQPQLEFLNEFVDGCTNSSGIIGTYPCSLRGAFGTCTIKEGLGHDTIYMHYWPYDTQQKNQIEESCHLAQGQWGVFNLKKELMDQAWQAYDRKEPTIFQKFIASLDQALHEAAEGVAFYLFQYFDLKPSNIRQGTLGLSVKSKKSDYLLAEPQWTQISLFRKIWSKFYVGWGGCGSLATAACAKNLGLNTNYAEVITEYGSPATTKEDHEFYFAKRGFCFGRGDFPDSCATYRTLKKQLAKKWQIMMIMKPPPGEREGHVEQLFLVGATDLDECFGITNSWGTPTIVFGGNGNFFHSSMSKYRGNAKINYEAFYFCDFEFCDTYDCLDSLNYKAEEILNFPKTEIASIRKIDEALIQSVSSLDPDYQWALLRRMVHLLYRNPSSENLQRAARLTKEVDQDQMKQPLMEELLYLVTQPHLKEFLQEDCPCLRQLPAWCSLLHYETDAIEILCTLPKSSCKEKTIYKDIMKCAPELY